MPSAVNSFRDTNYARDLVPEAGDAPTPNLSDGALYGNAVQDMKAWSERAAVARQAFEAFMERARQAERQMMLAEQIATALRQVIERAQHESVGGRDG